MPSDAGEEEEQKEWLQTDTEDLKLISDYTGLNFNECLELDCYTYKAVLKDAFIHKLKQSEEGREYLENCYILTLTNPDKQALRQRYGGDGLA